MPTHCVKCKKQYDKSTAVSFHCFPKDETMRERWLNALGLVKINFSVNPRVCSNHFMKDDFVFGGNLRKLRKDVIPSNGIRGVPDDLIGDAFSSPSPFSLTCETPQMPRASSTMQTPEMPTHMTFRRKGQVLNCQAREIIANVIGFMKDEAELYQAKREVKIPLINFKQRVLAATGISEKMYKVITKEAKDVKAGAVNSFLTPSKKPMIKKKIVVTIPNVAHESSKTDDVMKTLQQSMEVNARILEEVKIKPCRNIKKSFPCNENVNCYKCEICGFETFLKILLKKHINLEHKLGKNMQCCNFREFECSRCDFKSSSKLFYLKHRRSCFSRNKKFKCEHCAIEFSSKSGLQEHMKGTHLRTGTETYTQTTEFLSVGEEIDCKFQPLSEKLISRPLSCEFCSFPARDSDHLKYHIENKLCVPETTKWFCCDQCPYMTHLEYSFRVHRNRCCVKE